MHAAVERAVKKQGKVQFAGELLLCDRRGNETINATLRHQLFRLPWKHIRTSQGCERSNEADESWHTN